MMAAETKAPMPIRRRNPDCGRALFEPTFPTVDRISIPSQVKMFFRYAHMFYYGARWPKAFCVPFRNNFFIPTMCPDILDCEAW
jgi:hypothetical protein